MNFIIKILRVINIVSFSVLLLFCIFGIYEEIMGSADLENLFKKLNIPLNYRQYVIIFILSLSITIISYFVLKELWNN